MTQFASTLYPQTNPSSQMLLTFRERVKRGQFSVSDEAEWWLAFGPPPWTSGGDDMWSHARKVLTRLANFSG